MAILLINKGGAIPKLIGLSTDAKPTVNMPIGAKFTESDTGKQFMYSGTTWFPLVVATSIVGSLENVCGLLNVTTAGTRIQLPNIPCREVTIIARRLNTGYIYAGDSTTSATDFGIELASKEAFTFAVANANQVYIDSSVSGEGISYVTI